MNYGLPFKDGDFPVRYLCLLIVNVHIQGTKSSSYWSLQFELGKPVKATRHGGIHFFKKT
jgi:hypothetical protein